MDYVSFCDEIESVFTTKGLEKTPTVEVKLYAPAEETGTYQSLTPVEEQMAERALHKIAEKVIELIIVTGGGLRVAIL